MKTKISKVKVLKVSHEIERLQGGYTETYKERTWYVEVKKTALVTTKTYGKIKSFTTEKAELGEGMYAWVKDVEWGNPIKEKTMYDGHNFQKPNDYYVLIYQEEEVSCRYETPKIFFTFEDEWDYKKQLIDID